MTDLQTLFEVATDEIESPDLARTALTSAGRRRTRRRGAVAAVAATVAVGGVIVVPQLVDDAPHREVPSERPTPDPAPDDEDSEQAIAPPIDESVIQSVWDPSTVATLPAVDIGLPKDLTPEFAGAGNPVLEVPALAAARYDDRWIAVGYDNRWVPLAAPEEVGSNWTVSLSRDGARVAVVGTGGLWWRTLDPDDEWYNIDLRRSLSHQDAHVTWGRSGELVVWYDGHGGALVDLDSGDVTELPTFSEYDYYYDIAPDGRIVVRVLEPRSVVELDGTTVASTIRSVDLGGLNDLVADRNSLAATRIDLNYSRPRAADDGDGLIVVDRKTLTPWGFLPVTGRSGEWVDGNQISPVQWLDDSTLLISVLRDDTQTQDKVDQRYLVTWNIETGELAQVSRYDASYELSLAQVNP